jgi:hypothetical protein
MLRVIAFVLLASMVCVVSGCTSMRVGDFTVMSTKNINCQHVDITKLEQHPGVVGKDIRFLGWGANVKDAADKALEQYNGNLLVDAVVYVESGPFFGGYTVKGTSVTVPYQRPSK